MENVEKADLLTDSATEQPPHGKTDLEAYTSCDTPEGWMVRRDIPTPAGGVCMILHYFDANRNPAPKSEAVQFTIMEFDAQGRGIHSTYGYAGEWSKNGPPERGR